MDKINELDEKIERIRFYKLLGRTVYTSIFCLLIAFIFWISGTTVQSEALDNGTSNVELLYQTEEKNVSVVSDEPISLSQGDRELVERVCMAEAGNDIKGLMAVAQVIHNRAILWDMTPYEVATQKDQFAEPAKGEISAEAVQAVWAVFDENMKAFEDNNVTHFYAEDSQEPYWTVNKDFVGTRGGNRFYESKY